MTHRLSMCAPDAPSIDWKVSLARLEVGGKLIIRGRTAASVGGALAHYNHGDKHFVSKKERDFVYVIRVADRCPPVPATAPSPILTLSLKNCPRISALRAQLRQYGVNYE